MTDAKTARRRKATPRTKDDARPAPHLSPGRADPATDPAGYEVDFYLWSYTQADLLRQGRYGELDLPNVIEELESLGRSDKRALQSSYRVLLVHLLKWQYQPAKRSPSWRVTIGRERDNIELLERDSPSLRERARLLVEEIYPRARRGASAETSLPPTTFPAECPYTLDFLRDHDKLPG